jgi:hypothetical protein
MPRRYRPPIDEFIASTGREVFQSHEELIWPEKIVCGHPHDDDAVVTAN